MATRNYIEVIEWFGGKSEFDVAHFHNDRLDNIKKTSETKRINFLNPLCNWNYSDKVGCKNLGPE
jgi:hypothetical protein